MLDELVPDNNIHVNSKSVSKALNTYLTDSDLLNDELTTILITHYQVELNNRLENLFEFMSTDDFRDFKHGVRSERKLLTDFQHIFLPQRTELRQCDANVNLIKSANQVLYEYYHDISVAELKAYALVQLSYMFFTVYGRGLLCSPSASQKRSFPLIFFRQLQGIRTAVP